VKITVIGKKIIAKTNKQRIVHHAETNYVFCCNALTTERNKYNVDIE